MTIAMRQAGASRFRVAMADRHRAFQSKRVVRPPLQQMVGAGDERGRIPDERVL